MSTSALDLAQLRRETPGCQHVLHFNNAGASLITQAVLDATIAHLQREATTGSYEAARLANEAVERVYGAVAALLGCRKEEIAFMDNATRAWDMAFYSIPFQPGDRILTSVAEYASSYIAFLPRARKTGISIEVIPNDEFGQLSVAALRGMIDERVKLIGIAHVPTNGGLVNPAAAVGKIAREAGILYLLDACQSVGQLPVNVAEIGCDLLSATGRKYLRGPRGTGFLYVRREVMEQLEPPFLDLHAATWTARQQYEIRPDARRYEGWETNIAGKIGLGVAIDYALSLGVDRTYPRITALADGLRSRLNRIPGVQTHDVGQEQCGLVTFTVDGLASDQVRDRLFDQQINVSVTTPNHTRIDSEDRQLPAMVRASVHYYNSEDETEHFGEAIERLAKR